MLNYEADKTSCKDGLTLSLFYDLIGSKLKTYFRDQLFQFNHLLQWHKEVILV